MFTVNKSCESSQARSGKYVSKQSDARSISTPNFLVYTSHATPLHTTADVLEEISPKVQGVQLCLANMYDTFDKELTSKPEFQLHKFLNLQDYLLVLTMSDPLCHAPDHFNTKRDITVKGANGRAKISSDLYMELVSKLGVDIACPITDNISLNCTKNRNRLSVDRSLALLDECLKIREKDENIKSKTSFFGVIQGNDSVESRQLSATETAKRNVDGFLLENFDAPLKKEEFESLMASVITKLPKEKPRMMNSFGIPEIILTGVENGVDLFDATYPYVLAEEGLALTFWLGEDYQRGDGNDIAENKHRYISLWEKEFEFDTKPIHPNCQCFVCSNYSRSYLHHLLNTHEMLAEVLLMGHNLQHYGKFFEFIRKAIENDSFPNAKQRFLDYYSAN